jgi:hypothetical protein
MAGGQNESPNQNPVAQHAPIIARHLQRLTTMGP